MSLGLSHHMVTNGDQCALPTNYLVVILTNIRYDPWDLYQEIH